MAHRYLRKRGFTVAARNWRPPQGGGEIDIVAWEGDRLVFVEVKTRGETHAPADGSAPERGINEEKMRSLRRAARDYVRRSGADPAKVRFDAIAITGKAEALQHFRDAFPMDLPL